MTLLWAALVLLALWILVNIPTRRPDGELIKNLHPYRRMLGFMMPRRDDAVVFYDDDVRAEALLDYIERARGHLDLNVTHCLVKAAAIGLHKNPRMNQFVAGSRLYRRNHVAVTFSMKRKKLNKEAKLTAVKLRHPGGGDPRGACAPDQRADELRAYGRRDLHRQGAGPLLQVPQVRCELLHQGPVLGRLPQPVPGSFMESDGFYTSIFIANLGSLGMRAGFHHLYQQGTCPLFLMVGAIEDKPVVVEGKVVVRKMLHLRYTYDERIDDGLTSKYGMDSVKYALEHPDECFGPIGQAAAVPAEPSMETAERR